MTPPSWSRAKQVFSEALEKTGTERTQFVSSACGDDAELRAQVEALLAAHVEAGEFLASPTGGGADAAARAVAEDASDNPPEGPGTQIGPYKLLQLIGEGGFGMVYMADQVEPIRRRVALKIIKLGMDTKEVIARFESERQALAMMDHPNIARVLDAGATESGRPYFVMELVKGVPITEYCDANRLSTRERLDLFVDLCKAVHHAHEKGVIHRDIKPSNVMVTLHDGTPVPKVIDFGIAKATNQPLTEKTLFTAYGQFLGTPAYMSPEQAALGGLEIDRRCDVYSLGVLLYELLTGTTPFDPAALRSRAFMEVLRIIREDDPPTPSVRLNTLGERLTEIATSRHVEPNALAKLVRGDLDWIVMRAIEKDRRRRYASASELAGDVTRYFRNEPVLARKPSTAYRMQKFARRRRGQVLSVAGIGLATIAGATVVRIGPFAPNATPGPPSARLVHDFWRDSALGTPTRDGLHRLRYSPSRRGYEYIENVSGKTKRLVAVQPAYDTGWRRRSLSPDGSKMAIVTGGIWADSAPAELRLFSEGGDENGRLIHRWKLGALQVQVFGWSPDQNKVWVYSGRPNENSRADIEWIDLRTDSLHVLRTFENRPYFGPPSLSPDGRFITWHAADDAGRMFNGPEDAATDIFLASTDGKQEVRVRHPARDETPVFVPDGSGVVFRSSREGGDLWFLPLLDGRPAGEARAVWGDLGPKARTGVAYFAASGSLVYRAWGAGLGWELYTVDVDFAGRMVSQPRPVQAEQDQIEAVSLRAAISRPRFSPDARHLAFLRSGKREAGFDLVLRELSTASERAFPFPRLIDGESIDFCPDDRSVIITGADNGGAAIFRVKTTTGAIERLPIKPAWQVPALCVANNDVVYVADYQDNQPIHVVRRSSADGSEAVVFTDTTTYARLVTLLTLFGSPDGRRIAILTQPYGWPWGLVRREGGKLGVISSTGGKLLNIPGTWTAIHGVMWLPNGRELLIARESERQSRDAAGLEITLWRVPLDGAPPSESGRFRLPADMDTQWGSENYSLHPTGSRIVFEALTGKVQSQLWAIDNLMAFIKTGAVAPP